MSNAILRLPAVIARTGLSRSTIYSRMKEGSFPISIPLGSRSVGWLESEVDAWLEARVQAARSNIRCVNGGRKNV